MESSVQLPRPDCPALFRVKESDCSESDEFFSSPWRSRIRSRSPILDFKEKSSRIPLHESPISVSVQCAESHGRKANVKETSPSPMKKPGCISPSKDDVVADDNLEKDKEMHVGGVMETLLKHLPAPSSVGLFTASCLLLLPLILVLRRYS